MTRIGCVSTLADLARAFGVAYRVVKDWPKREGFPLESDGSYHLVKIAIWRERTFEKRGRQDDDDEEGDQTKAEALRQKEWVRLEKEVIGLQEIKGELVRVETVINIFRRSIAIHNTLATQLQDRVLQLLPAKTKPADRKRVMGGVAKAVADLRHGMATAATDWGKELAISGDSDEEPGE